MSSKTVRIPVQSNQWLRNGKYPHVSVQNELVAATNHILRYHPKALEFSTGISNVAAGASGSTTRWRAMLHTTGKVQSLYVWFLMLRTGDLSGIPANPAGKCTILTAAGAAVGTASFNFGAKPGTIPSVPANIGEGVLPIRGSLGPIAAISADTDYQVIFSNEDRGRIMAAAVYESTIADNLTDYFATSAGNGPILDIDRSGIIPALRTSWLRGGSGLLYWASETDATAPTNATSTFKNVTDTSLSRPAAASHPGYTLDLSNRARKSETALGVPCKLWVYGKHSAGGGGAGSVILVNSANASMGGVTGFSTTAGWLSTTFYLPASSDTYHLYFSNNGVAGTMTPYAASLLQYE